MGATLFDGVTFSPQKDSARLSRQLEAVLAVMRDGKWRTFAEIGVEMAERGTPAASEAGISARLRDLRKVRFGGHRVDRRRRDGGLHEYRVEIK